MASNDVQSRAYISTADVLPSSKLPKADGETNLLKPENVMITQSWFRPLLLLLVFSLPLCARSAQSQPQDNACAADAPQTTGGNGAITSDDRVGVLELSDGSMFKTALYGMKTIGQLRTDKKVPYFILSGRTCTECDENTSIYIHSPRDGPMKNEAEQRRFSYPGKETNYEDGSPLHVGRMFFGDCLASHPNAVVWFERSLGEDRKWHEDVFLAEVKGDNLTTEELHGKLPKPSEAQDSVRTGRCRELPGIDRSSEP
jgi:hypothetical protein